MPSTLTKYFNDTVRTEKQVPGHDDKWRVYKKDDEDRFQMVDQFDKEADAVALAETLGD